MYQKEIKGKGYFRKSKAYGLVCGISLASFLFVGAQVAQANEVVVETSSKSELVTGNPSTNLTEAQAPAPEANTKLATQAGNQSGTITAPVTSSELNNAVDNAKDAGVIVTEAVNPVVHENIESAQADLSSQIKDVKNASEKQEVNTAVIKEAVEKNADIDRQNEAEKKRVEEANKKGQEEVNQRNIENKSKIDKENKEGQEAVDRYNQTQRELLIENQKAIDEALTYNKDEEERVEREYQIALAEYERIKASTGVNDPNYIKAKEKYDSELALFNEKKAEVDERLKEISSKIQGNALNPVVIDNTGLTDIWTNLAPKEVIEGVKVVGEGTVKSFNDVIGDDGGYRVYVEDSKGILDNQHIVKKVYLANEPVGLQDSKNDGWWILPLDTWITIPKGIVLADNSVRDLEFRANLENSTFLREKDKLYLRKGSNSIVIKDSAADTTEVAETIVREYRVKGTSDSFLWSDVSLDIDGGQYQSYGNINSVVVSVGGGLKYDGKTISSEKYLGFTSGKHPLPKPAGWGEEVEGRKVVGGGLDDERSLPDGAVVVVSYGNSFRVSTSNISGGLTTGMLVSDFGTSINSDIPVFPVKPTLPEPPKTNEVQPPQKGTPNKKEIPPKKEVKEEKFVPKVFTPEKYTPIKPVVLPHVQVPEKEQLKVTVHPVLVRQTPDNVKAVVNEDGISVDGHLVPKGSVQTWVLTNTNLKAGRPVTTSYSMTDPLPAGFELDLKATAEKNTAWVFSYDNGTVLLTATEGTLNSLNANLNQDVVIPLAYLVGRPVNDGGTYKNTFVTKVGTPSGIYTTVSNIPVIYTPGRDPKDPRPPYPETEEPPTPFDNLIEPRKDVVDGKGNSINGQSVLPGTVLNYVAEQDFDQYKGIVASQTAIAKGFVYVDDYLDKALDGQSMIVNSITAKNGDDVSKLLDMYHVLSKDSLDDKLQALIKESGITPVGEFYLWVAKDPQAFYNAYVSKGLDITYNVSFKVKDTFIGKVTNQTFQIDFGNGYYGNIVENDVPEMKVNKDVNIDGKAVDKGTIKLGDIFTYTLEGWVIPSGRGYDIDEYRFVDIMQSSHDEYKGFKVTAKVDITLSDGTKIAKGTDLSSYVVQSYNINTGTFELKFKEEFLSQVPRTSEFGSDVILEAKRVKSGTVENEFTLYVNGIPVKSDKVVTETPEPPKPPQPTPPAPVIPSKVELPKTGAEASYLLSFIGIVALFVGLIGFSKIKKEVE